MKFVLFCWSLLLLCPLMLHAQSNYKPGYVVNLEGDTLRGYINYKEWDYSPASVSFRVDAGNSATETVMDVSNTRYFEITGMEAYQRYQGPITMNQVEAGRISFESKTLLEQVVVFLKINYTGDLVDLLSYSDQVKTRYFFREKNGSQPQELYYHRYYATSNNTSQVTVQKGYVGQLQHLVNEYVGTVTKLNREVENAQYHNADLEKLFARINGMDVTALQAASKEMNKHGVRYYAGISLNRSDMKIFGMSEFENPDSRPASFLPRVTFGADIFMNQYIQKLYLRVEGALKMANYLVENEVPNNYGYTRYSYKLSHQNFALSPQVIYNLYNKENFKVNIGLAGEFNLSNYYHNVYRVEQVDYELPERNREGVYPKYLKPAGYWLSYSFRTGMELKKRFEFYAMYTPYTIITPFIVSTIHIRSIYVGVNYHFNRY